MNGIEKSECVLFVWKSDFSQKWTKASCTSIQPPSLTCSATRRPRHATEEEVRYLLQIQGVLSNTTDESEKHILINNINEELRGSEVSLASNKKTSYVIQSVLQSGNRDQLRLFLSYSKGTSLASLSPRLRRAHVHADLRLALHADRPGAGQHIPGRSPRRGVRRAGAAPGRRAAGIPAGAGEPVRGERAAAAGGGELRRERLARAAEPAVRAAGLPQRPRGGEEAHREGGVDEEGGCVGGRNEPQSNAAMAEAFDEARSAVLFALAEMGASDREWLMKNPHGCFIVQMLMNNLPADQRTKLAHILLDVEDPDAAQKLIRELIVDVNGSRSLEGLVRSASDEVVNSLFISWELGEEKRDSFMRTEQSF